MAGAGISLRGTFGYPGWCPFPTIKRGRGQSMAKKKRKAPKRSPKSSSRPKPPPATGSGIPDRRVLEGMMRDFLGGILGGSAADTPLGQAQKIVDEAFAAADPEAQIALAHKALKVS